MIFGNINQEKTYEFLPENVKACFKYVKEYDLLKYVQKKIKPKYIENLDISLFND